MKWVYILAIQIQIERMKIYLDIDRLQLDCRDILVENTILYRLNHHFSGFKIIPVCRSKLSFSLGTFILFSIGQQKFKKPFWACSQYWNRSLWYQLDRNLVEFQCYLSRYPHIMVHIIHKVLHISWDVISQNFRPYGRLRSRIKKLMFEHYFSNDAQFFPNVAKSVRKVSWQDVTSYRMM